MKGWTRENEDSRVLVEQVGELSEVDPMDIVDRLHADDWAESNPLKTEALHEIKRLRGKLCKCDMRTKLVGDGCQYCNPALAYEIARDNIIEKIKVLLEEAKDDYKWGGSEDADGGLDYGFVDFDELEENIIQILREVE